MEITRRNVEIPSVKEAFTAAIKAAAHDDFIFVGGSSYEGVEPGGQLTTTTIIENFPGFPGGVDANKLMSDMREQAVELGADIRRGSVTSVDCLKILPVIRPPEFAA